MDSYLSNESEDNLNSLTKKSLNSTHENDQTLGNLSNLTAKYNKSKHFSNETNKPTHINIVRTTVDGNVTNKNLHDKSSFPPVSKKQICLDSSEDDDSESEFVGFSLAGLATKMKTCEIKHAGPSKPCSREETVLDDLSALHLHDTIINDEVNYTDLLCRRGDLNLFQLYNKDLVKNNQQPENIVSTSDNNPNSTSSNADINLEETLYEVGGQNTNPKQSKQGDLNAKFVAAKFSSDSDSDEPFSLSGLALKHKNISQAVMPSDVDVAQSQPKHFNYVPILQDEKQHVNCESDLNSDEPFSLSGLALKHNNMSQADMPSDNDTARSQPKHFILEPTPQDEKQYVKCGSDDESISLSSLALKLPQVETEFDGECPQSKPKSVLSVVNYHRQHSKSESDRFSTSIAMPADSLLMKKGFDNETSTSLGSLKGNSQFDSDFQFSLGCAIPNSFRSKHITTSLCTVRMSNSQVNTISNSDPDISFQSRKSARTSSEASKINTVNSLASELLSTDDFLGAGINLSSAIKTSSSPRVSESLVSEDDVDILTEPDDDKIVTLLDNLSDDEMVGVDHGSQNDLADFSYETEENCMMDASPILKLKLKLHTRKCSSFGKVVCRRWRLQSMPYIRKDDIKTSVIPFTFSVPSPDDVIAGFLARRQEIS